MSTRAQGSFTSYGNCTEKTYGFASVNGQDYDIPPTYCDATGFSEGLASVKFDGKWGYIDVNQKTRIAFSFDYAARFKYGHAIVQQGKFRGVIDKQGDYTVPPIYLDLQMLEIDGKPYYVSRDSTFFAGLIDSKGEEVIPHRYTYLMPLTGYGHLPFYTVFREIDTALGSFYEQFEDNPFLFSPEQGSHDLYDSQFNKLASRQSRDYSNGFPHDKLQKIDAFLLEARDKPAEEKVKTVQRILSLPDSTLIAEPVSLYVEYASRKSSEVDEYLEGLGYRFFTENGKTGLKKGNDILIPAAHRQLRFVNGVILFPQPADMPMLEKHYGGVYRNKEKGIFDIFAVLSADDEPTVGAMQYSLSGDVSLPIAETVDGSKKLISTINSLGFLYLHTRQDETGLVEKKYSLVSWIGEELLPPVYQKIEVTKAGHVLVSQEKEAQEGIEEHVGLFSPTGEEIVPVGVYSSIKAFSGCERSLYLVTWSDPYPTMAEWKERNDSNKTYVILEVDGSASRVVNTFTASTVHMMQLDTETGMLQYIKRVSGE